MKNKKQATCLRRGILNVACFKGMYVTWTYIL